MVNYNENVYGRRGLDGRDHIPALPFWVALIRIAQFILALIVVILIGYASSVFGAAFIPGYGMTFFTFAWTVIFLLYIFITPLWYPEAYHYWAHLGFETTLVVFWLVTWALLAQEASEIDSVVSLDNQALADAGLNLGDIFPTSWTHAINATKAGAALGALTWLLFIITLVVFGRFLHKHRVANGATGFSFGRSTARPADVEASTAAPEEKYPTSTQPPVELNDVHGTEHPVSLPAAA